MGLKIFLGLTLIEKKAKGEEEEEKVKMILDRLDLEELKKANNIEEFMFCLLDFYKDKIFDEFKFHRLFYILMVVQKGLTG